MAKSSSSAPHNNLASKGSKGHFSYTSVIVALLAVGGAYVYFDRTSTLNKFSVAVTEKLCDQLGTKKNEEAASESVKEPSTVKVSKESLFNPKISGGKSYNARNAMEMRYEKLHDVCNRYSDVMRPESLMQKQLPNRDAFQWDASSGIALCNPVGVGHQAFESMFVRLRSADDNQATNALAALKENFPVASKGYKKAIMARHPMERLLSIYRLEYGRKHFATFTDVAKGEDQEGVSFPDFVHLVVNGPKELAEFMAENNLEGQSMGIDTGMVDGKGKSKLWDSYWHQCGLCHPHFKPHYILHFDHAKADEEVLVELLGNKESAKKWLKVERNSVVSKEDVIKHFYSQLTKDEINGIYEKYRVDFELFGYTPDYFLQFGLE